MTTFEATDYHRLTIHPAVCDRFAVQFEDTDGEYTAGHVFAVASAPALALAILEAAGVIHHDPEDTPHDPSQRTEHMGDLNEAAFKLARHVNNAEKAAYLAATEAVMAHEDALDAEGTARAVLEAAQAAATITTVEELDALPNGSIIRDNGGLALQRSMVLGWWQCTNGTGALSSAEVATEGLPARVLHWGQA